MKRFFLVSLVAVGASACASTPAAPFDTLKNSNVVAYRLQNYEPPAAAAATPGAIPGLPPQILQWAQQAAPALQQMLPPGLIPPGLIPGMPGALGAPAPQDGPRFHGFRILEQAPVVDMGLKEELGELMGDEESYQAQHANCMYAEMGLSFSATPGAPPNDVLVSFSCNQMQGHNFVWPHPTTGLTPDTVKTLSQVVARLFPAGGAAPAPMAMVEL